MRPRLIGIAGGTASGKTTLASALARRLDAVLVAHDRYYFTARAETNFDHPDALDNDQLTDHLRELKRGQPVRLPQYDFSRHQRSPESEWDHVTPKPTVIVEGILLFAIEPLRSLFDVSIFVEAPDDLRLMRRLRRDIAERGRTAHDVLDQYETTVRPMHERYVAPSRIHAHHVVDGTAPIEQTLDRLLRTLEER